MTPFQRWLGAIALGAAAFYAGYASGTVWLMTAGAVVFTAILLRPILWLGCLLGVVFLAVMAWVAYVMIDGLN